MMRGEEKKQFTLRKCFPPFHADGGKEQNRAEQKDTREAVIYFLKLYNKRLN